MKRQTWTRHDSGNWTCAAIRAEIIPLLTGRKRTGWGVYVDNRNVGSWSKLEQAKQRAEEHFAKLPNCALTLGCLCAGHARGSAATAPCDTSETQS